MYIRWHFTFRRSISSAMLLPLVLFCYHSKYTIHCTYIIYIFAITLSCKTLAACFPFAEIDVEYGHVCWCIFCVCLFVFSFVVVSFHIRFIWLYLLLFILFEKIETIPYHTPTSSSSTDGILQMLQHKRRTIAFPESSTFLTAAAAASAVVTITVVAFLFLGSVYWLVCNFFDTRLSFSLTFCSLPSGIGVPKTNVRNKMKPVCIYDESFRSFFIYSFSFSVSYNGSF